MTNDIHGKRILSGFAHPDDEAFGMGGTLAMRGAEVYSSCATLGEAGDVDLLQIASASFPVHVKVNYRPVLKQREQAAACHASQGSGQKPRGLNPWLMRLFVRSVDRFTQSFPEPKPHQRTKNDLFWGIDDELT